jgi:hypothetical protein
MVESWSRLLFVAAGVDVDGHQRLGFVNDNVAAAFQVDLAREGVLQLAVTLKRSKIGWCSCKEWILLAARGLMREIMARMRS